MFNSLKQTHDFVAAVVDGDVATSLEIMFRFGRERATAAIKGASELQTIVSKRETFVETFHLYMAQFREIGATERHIAELKRTFCDGFDDTVSRRPASIT
jgi:hypothetical protein